MTVRVNLDADNGVYELGDDIDGVFVPFATVPETDVQARVQAAQAGAAQATTTPAGTPPEQTPPPGSSETPDEERVELSNLTTDELEAELARRQSSGGQ